MLNSKLSIGDKVRVIQGQDVRLKSGELFPWTHLHSIYVGKTFEISKISITGHVEFNGLWFHSDWVIPERDSFDQWSNLTHAQRESLIHDYAEEMKRHTDAMSEIYNKYFTKGD